MTATKLCMVAGCCELQAGQPLCEGHWQRHFAGLCVVADCDVRRRPETFDFACGRHARVWQRPQPRPVAIPATDKQRRLLLILFHEAGVTDRDERLAITGQIIGREVQSSNDLTLAEASVLIDQLKDALGMPAREGEPR